MKLSCLIVEDEPMARKGLEEYVRDIPFLRLTGMCENASKANEFLREHTVDLMLLDIQMPGLTGIDFLRGLENPPMAIFITAHPDYALESYELAVIDYLVKPVLSERFSKAIQKAFDFYSVHHVSSLPEPDYFFVKCDRVFEKINYTEVLYIEAMQNYCIVHTAARKLITYITLSALEAKLPESKFIRIHKSYIVSIEKITALDGNDVSLGSVQLPISRALKPNVLKKVLGNNLFKR
jgi:DNA-binding LytR/AlgR family response regulator